MVQTGSDAWCTVPDKAVQHILNWMVTIFVCYDRKGSRDLFLTGQLIVSLKIEEKIFHISIRQSAGIPAPAQVLYNVYPVCQEIKPDGIPQEWITAEHNQIVKRNFGADVRKVVEQKGKKELQSSWYFGTTKTVTSNRTVKFGETLYRALKAEKVRQAKNEMKYGEYYTIHVIKVEKDEKGNDMKRIVPIQKCINSPLPRVRMVCIAENGQYTSTDSFKFCSRVIHKELLLAFDYHSLRHTHATLLIENGADVKDVQTRLGHTNIETTLQTYVHDTEKMVERSVDLFEQVTQAKTS